MGGKHEFASWSTKCVWTSLLLRGTHTTGGSDASSRYPQTGGRGQFLLNPPD